MTRSIQPVLFAAVINLLFGCGGSGVTHSDGGAGGGGGGDGGGGGSFSWVSANNPVGAAGAAAELLYTAPEGSVYFGSRDGLFRTTDRGQTWSPINVGFAGATAQSLGANSSGELLAGIGKSAYRLTGGVWQLATGIVANLKVSGFALDSTGAVVAVTAFQGQVWRSTDNGSSYVKISDNPAIGQPGVVGALWVITKGRDGTLYTGGESSAGIFRSFDNGVTWQQFGLSTSDGYNGNLNNIVFNKAGDILATRPYQGQPISRYSGGIWTVSSSGIPIGDSAGGVKVSASGHVYAGTFRSRGSGTFSGTVYASEDGGKTWSAADSGLPNNGISHLALTNDGYLIAAGSDGKVWVSSVPVP
jgi:hypothetical protein